MGKLVRVTSALFALGACACTVHQTAVPPPTGPSDLVVSLVVPPTAVITPVGGLTTGVPANFNGASSCAAGAASSGVCISTSVTITTYAWDFGDGVTASGALVTHTYVTSRQYQVNLTVTNSQNLSTKATTVVTVAAAAAPTASFVVSPTKPVHNVDTVNFNAAASSAAAGHSIVNYHWNFGDSSTADTTTNTTTHLYTTANTFKSTLTVTDDAGQTATTEVDVTVS